MIANKHLALPAPELAPLLLGCEIRAAGRRAIILETEAYQGEEDRGCHASRGRTPRTATLYEAPGTLYCYLCYGMHVLTNIVCDRAGLPAAVLLRGIAIAGLPLRSSNGPGKLSRLLALTQAHDGARLGRGKTVQLHGTLGAFAEVRRGPRVGIAYAGSEWGNRPWRFWLTEWRGEAYPQVPQRPYPAST